MSKTGYAVGVFIGSDEYLTVIGSTYDPYGLVFADRATAEARATEIRARRSYTNAVDPIVVCRVRTVNHPGVTVTQTAYRVLPDEDD